MNTSEMAKRLQSYIGTLVELFLSRNREYSGQTVWYSNFIRNAELCRVFRLKEILEEPYGQSVR